MNKHEREKKALAHVEKMLDIFPSEIKNSINKSVVYKSALSSNKKDKKPSKHFCSISVMPYTTEQAIQETYYDLHSTKTKIGVLNFASFKWPGGGFVRGSIAQEEALCHASTLYNVISDKKFESEYKENRQDLNGGLYKDWAIYSPGIVFPFDEYSDDVYCDVLTCPAPNRSALDPNKESQYMEALRSRIKMVLDIFNSQKVDVVILGAFGCGVFGNDPKVVAEIFKEYLEKQDYSFIEVVFAIPPSQNFDAFGEVFFG